MGGGQRGLYRERDADIDHVRVFRGITELGITRILATEEKKLGVDRVGFDYLSRFC